VADDEWTRQVLAALLERRGHTVDRAPDAEAALEAVGTHPPDLVLSDLLSSRNGGWALARRLRERAGTADVPILVLTTPRSEDERICGYHAGVDGFLAKPFRLQEVDLHVERALRRSAPRIAGATSEGLAGPGFAGSLATLGPSALLTLLEFERKTGALTLEHGDARVCLLVHEGRILQARDPHGAPACLYDLLAWTDGGFAFEPRMVETTDEVGLSTQHLLMEAARRQDEQRRPA
jgi:DNA-binding response OmpR family regulator